MAVMTREQILATPKAQRTEIDLSDIPGWGVVLVKDLTALERDRIEQSCVTERLVVGKNGKRKLKQEMTMENLRAKFVAACVVDEEGERLFSEADVQALGALNAKAIDRIVTVIQERNGLRNEDFEELVGNFSVGQSGE
jgi:hypothetical protein